MERFADRSTSGAAFGIAAYAIWGLLPLFMKMLQTVPAPQILAHRVLWSLILLAVIAAALRHGGQVMRVLGNRRLVATLAATASLLTVNWLVYIWAVNSGHVIETSLGYFILPILHVVLGTLFLKEQLSRWQMLAVGLAAIGVATLGIAQGVLPWIALVLAVSFGSYGLLRKLTPVDALAGLLVETLLLAPFMLGYLLWVEASGAGRFGTDAGTDALLIVSGLVTAVPLLLFAAAAKRLRLATLGLLQYIAPTLQFLLAVLLFDEPFTRAHVVTFACIWSGLILYAADAYRGVRSAPVPATPE